jgi:hypothetical protein
MANRTALFSRKQSGGVFTVSDLTTHPGDIWFVDSGTGVDGVGYGQNPDAPVATLDYAVGLCTADNGDVIYVMPGHNETLTAATSCVVDKAGVSIIGLGKGMNRPIFDYDNTAGTIEMDAANTRLSNVVLRASVSATVTAINVDADDVTIDNCFFTWETTGDEFITCIDVDAFDRCTISDNVLETEEGAAQATEAIRIDDTNDTVIQRNVFRGTWTNAAIINEGALCARLMILDNIIYNSDTSNYNGIDMGALATTGIVKGNTITTLYGSAVAKIYRDGDLTSHDNTFANAISERAVGRLDTTGIPATSSA